MKLRQVKLSIEEIAEALEPDNVDKVAQLFSDNHADHEPRALECIMHYALVKYVSDLEGHEQLCLFEGL